MKVSAIIPAAGVGKRFGEKKQLKFFKGEALFIHTLKPFLLSNLISEIVLVVSANEIENFQKELNNISYSKPIFLVSGGERRQDSVKNGVLASNKLSDMVCIHDAARPFISGKLIEKSILACQKADGSVVAIQSNDTVKISKNKKISHTLDREKIWLVQTPQVFWRHKLIKAINDVSFKDITVTDESSIMEKMGYKIILVKGENKNFKITNAFDWKLAKNLIV